jgi:hypothetical protein
MKILSSFILLIMKFTEVINCPFQLPFRALDISSSSYAVELLALTDTDKHLLLTYIQDTVNGAVHVMSV